jgi:hypothetical protein
MRWAAKRAAVVAPVVAAFGYGCYQHKYPYGHSHCCDKGLGFALLQYADEHDGWFPRGDAIPETSVHESPKPSRPSADPARVPKQTARLLSPSAVRVASFGNRHERRWEG